MNQLNPIIQSKSHTPASPSINLYFTFLSTAFVCLCSTWLAGDSKLQKKSHNFSGWPRDTGNLKNKQKQFVTLMKKINQNLWCWLTKSSRVLVWVSGKYGLTEFSLEVDGKWCIVFCVNFKKMPVNQIYFTHHVKWTKDYDITSRGQIKYWYWHMKWDTCKKTTDKTTDNRPWGNLELKFQSTETNLACITDKFK